MKKNSNYYEHLRCPGISDENASSVKTDTMNIYFSDDESLLLHIDLDNKSRYTIGYNIHFSNGRNTCVPPALESGYFTSEQNAILYFLGYVKTYQSYFSDDCMKEVNRLIMENSQTELF